MSSNFTNYTLGIAEQLHRLANEVEHIANCDTDEPAAFQARDIISEITWAFANLNMGLLVRKAYREDEKRLTEAREPDEEKSENEN